MVKHLTTLELADRLRLSPDRVRILARAGILPGRRLTPRGRLLFDQDEVLTALRRAGRGAEKAEPVPAA
jgi:hypothetical protein